MAQQVNIHGALQYAAKLLNDSYGAPQNMWLMGDVNRDGKIDRKDIDLIIAASRSRPGDPGWNPDADLNMDGVVDALDLAICTAFQGTAQRVFPMKIPGVPDIAPLTPIGDVWQKGLEEARVTQVEYGQIVTGSTFVDFLGGDLGELLLGQPGWRARLDRAVQTMNAPFTFGALSLLEQLWKGLYVPEIPRPDELLDLLMRQQITADEYLFFHGLNGFSGRWAVARLESFYKLPEFKDLQVMRWRALIDGVDFKDYLLRQGWHPDVLDALDSLVWLVPSSQELQGLLWRGVVDEDGYKAGLVKLGFHPDVASQLMALAWLIPGPSDLVRFVVREVISPSDFIVHIGRQGYSPYWAGAYWTAHFQLPAPNFLYDAFHREVITDAELQKYIFWHDYMPELRPGISKSDLEIMRGLTKTLIPRVDLRRAWELDKLSDEELERRYRWLGYEDDAPLMAEIQKAVAMEAENNAIATAAAQLYRQGYMTAGEFEDWLRVANFSAARIQKTRAAEDLRYRLDYVKDLQDTAIEAYRKDVYTIEELEAELINLGMQPERVEALIAKESFKKLPKPKAAAA